MCRDFKDENYESNNGKDVLLNVAKISSIILEFLIEAKQMKTMTYYDIGEKK